MKCPCEECLKVAVCRHKDYDRIIHSCIDLKEYVLGDRKDHRKRVKVFCSILNPVNWKLGKEQVGPGQNYITEGYEIVYLQFKD
jgi:hypothetical protein